MQLRSRLGTLGQLFVATALALPFAVHADEAELAQRLEKLSNELEAVKAQRAVSSAFGRERASSFSQTTTPAHMRTLRLIFQRRTTGGARDGALESSRRPAIVDAEMRTAAACEPSATKSCVATRPLPSERSE